MSNLPKAFKEQLKNISFITDLTVLDKLESKGLETTKFLFGLSDSRVFRKCTYEVSSW